MEKSSASPERTRPTRFLTGACRCDVPNKAAAVVVSACNCSGRTFDGPDPNRPSRGLMSAGIWRGSAMVSRVVSGPDGLVGRAAACPGERVKHLAELLDDIGGSDPAHTACVTTGQATVLRGV